MMKKLLSLLIAVLILSCMIISVWAAQPNVVDNSDLLTAEEEADLQEAINSFVDTYGLDLVILTCDSLGGKTATAYADDFYDYNGYGIGDDHSGILLLVSMEYRDWAVSTCGEAINQVSDSDIDSAMEEVLPYLSYGDYAGAFVTFVEEMDAAVLTTGENFVSSFLMALVVGVIVGGIAILVMRSGMNTARAQSGAASYSGNGLDLTNRQDIYLYSHVSRTAIPKNTSSSTHTSSSGRSHGGRSGKF